jgi:hypothetical protein
MPHAYAFQHLPFRTRNRVVHLGPASYILGTLANGARSLRDIARAIGDSTPDGVERARAGARSSPKDSSPFQPQNA